MINKDKKIISTPPLNLAKLKNPMVEKFRREIEFLLDGEKECFHILMYMMGSFKQWPDMFIYMKRNRIIGEKIIEIMQNESPDGGGYLLGCTWIHNRMQGDKHQLGAIYGDDLV